MNSLLTASSSFITRLLLAAFGLFATPGVALDPAATLSQYVQTVWRMEEGLPHNSVSAVIQTRDGYIWLGTYGGLVRFDGIRFVVFDNRNSSLETNEIRTLVEDQEGTLWIGTLAGGLYRFKEGKLEPFTRGIEHRTISDLAVDETGKLWVGTSGGLYSITVGRTQHFAKPEGFLHPFVNALYLSKDHFLIATTGGLYRFRKGRAEPIAQGRFEGTDCKAIIHDREGRYWAGTDNRLTELKFNEDSNTFSVQDETPLQEVWGQIETLLEDRDGNLWIGTYGGGLYRRSESRIDRISTEHGFLDHRPWALWEDREGNLWIGTRSGLARLRDGAATTWSRQEGLPADIVRTVLESEDGTLWIGSEGGLSRFTEGRLRNFLEEDGLPGTPVRSLLPGGKHRLWVGTDQGIGELDTDQGQFRRTIHEAGGQSPLSVRNMLRDREGRVWVGTLRGVMVADKGLTDSTLRRPKELEDIESQPIESLFEDREGGIWIGTIRDGMRRWYQGQAENPVLLGGASVGVRSFHEDDDGTFYVGTVGSSLFIRRPGGSFQQVTTRSGLPDDSIWSILPSGDHFWMSSDRGVFNLKRSALLNHVDGNNSSLEVESFIGPHHGMKSRECNGGGRPSGLIARDGRIWFPTNLGAVAIDTRRVALNHLPPPVVIEEVVIDRQPQSLENGISGQPGTRDIEIHYTGLSFVDPAQVRFRYRLHGLDDSWVEVGPRRAAYFSNLPPGNYELHVQAANNDGVWNEEGARLALRVLPSFYETWLFRISAALILALIGGLGFQWRILELRAREKRLRGLVVQRTQELEQANTRLEHLATVDDLTGIANYRRFSENLEREWSRCRRTGENLSLLLCDIDDFKAYNDTYGHLAGDAALKTVARTIADEVHRDSDLAARYGGEEFAVILSSTDENGARGVANRIQNKMRLLDIEHRASRAAGYLTLSIGCASARPADNGPNAMQDLIAAADRALYQAKAEGRDQVVSDKPSLG